MPNGFNYAYKDSTDRSSTISPFTDRTLDRLDGALGSGCCLFQLFVFFKFSLHLGTLHQIYVDKKGLGYVLYNDEPPEVTMNKK